MRAALHDLGARALSLLDPETAHNLAVAGLKAGLGPTGSFPDDPCLFTEIGALKVPTCIGLAAGFDKNAEAADGMLKAGFGFVECGTVTPRPQAGNPRPRLFRLSEDRAVINRMGFNNHGLEAAARNLAGRRRRSGVVGANVGANKDSEDRAADYVAGLTALWPHADYFTMNVSSPNTPGLRDLQGEGALDDLLGRTAEARRALAAEGGDKPLLLKVAPDLDEAAIDVIVGRAQAHGLTGLIVGNTTVARPSSLKSAHRKETGGLSGAPLFSPSTEVLRLFRERAGASLCLIGCGGVSSGADAYAKIRAGACAVQLYTALVYQGVGLIGRIKKDLARRLRADGFVTVAEAVGAR